MFNYRLLAYGYFQLFACQLIRKTVVKMKSLTDMFGELVVSERPEPF